MTVNSLEKSKPSETLTDHSRFHEDQIPASFIHQALQSDSQGGWGEYLQSDISLHRVIQAFIYPRESSGVESQSEDETPRRGENMKSDKTDTGFDEGSVSLFLKRVHPTYSLTNESIQFLSMLFARIMAAIGKKLNESVASDEEARVVTVENLIQALDSMLPPRLLHFCKTHVQTVMLIMKGIYKPPAIVHIRIKRLWGRPPITLTGTTRVSIAGLEPVSTIVLKQACKHFHWDAQLASGTIEEARDRVELIYNGQAIDSNDNAQDLVMPKRIDLYLVDRGHWKKQRREEARRGITIPSPSKQTSPTKQNAKRVAKRGYNVRKESQNTETKTAPTENGHSSGDSSRIPRPYLSDKHKKATAGVRTRGQNRLRLIPTPAEGACRNGQISDSSFLTEVEFKEPQIHAKSSAHLSRLKRIPSRQKDSRGIRRYTDPPTRTSVSRRPINHSKPKVPSGNRGTIGQAGQSAIKSSSTEKPQWDPDKMKTVLEQCSDISKMTTKKLQRLVQRLDSSSAAFLQGQGKDVFMLEAKSIIRNLHLKAIKELNMVDKAYGAHNKASG